MDEKTMLEIIQAQQKTINALLSLQSVNCKNETCEGQETIEAIEKSSEAEKAKTFSSCRQQEFEAFLKKKGRAQNTIDSYSVAIRKFFEKYKVLSADTLSEWEEELKTTVSAKTVNLRIIGMIQYMKFVGFNGYEFNKLKEQKKGFCDNAISEEQYNQLIEWAKVNSIQTYKIVKIIGATGVRVSELIRLKKTDLERGYVDITSKANKARRIYFPDTLVEEIKPYCTEEYLIMNRFGTPMTTRGVASNLVRAGEKAGIPKEVMHPHSFRHFFAKQFLKNNNNITLLGDILGHSDISTTAIYTRMTSKEQQKEINEIVNW
jgi:site-specific recombinase XerD